MTKTERLRNEAAATASAAKKAKAEAPGAVHNGMLLAFGDDDEEGDDGEDERRALKETEDRIQKLKRDRVRMDEAERNEVAAAAPDGGQETNSKMMAIIRAKLAGDSKKRTFSEMDGRNEGDVAPPKKTKTDSDREYERLKQQFLAKQRGASEEGPESGGEDAVGGEDPDHPANEGAVQQLLRRREEYAKKTRMNRKERDRATSDGLHEFMRTLDAAKGAEDGGAAKPKQGKMDQSTGIRFDSGSGDDEDYDPNWFRAKLVAKKRPQDVEIYSVDDYVTVRGTGHVRPQRQRVAARRESGGETFGPPRDTKK